MAEPTSEADLRDLVCLTMVPGVGPHTSRALLGQFGTAGRVLGAAEAALREVPGVGPKLAGAIARARREHDADAELALCRGLGVRPVPLADPEYPATLRDIPDPPPLLYVRGAIAPGDALAIAIVGSRRCTPYGVRVAERLAGSLARVGLTVVSGLARGIDAAAHRGALMAGGRTIAVLANGLAEVYPPEHAGLADEVAASGALVCEFSMRQEPLPGLFPQRNRVISGLSLGVVVVEASPRSGSLSTAKHAMEQNREVFAVPGPVDSLASRGCHRLVREVKPAADAPAVRHPAELKLSDQERSVLGHLDDTPRPIDELIARTGLAASQVMATLSVLEMRRLVRRSPGNQFARV